VVPGVRCLAQGPRVNLRRRMPILVNARLSCAEDSKRRRISPGVTSHRGLSRSRDASPSRCALLLRVPVCVHRLIHRRPSTHRLTFHRSAFDWTYRPRSSKASYDPHPDVVLLVVPSIPETGLINNVESDGCDAMPKPIKQRRTRQNGSVSSGSVLLRRAGKRRRACIYVTADQS
jgi:hypothetical protein